MVVVCFMGTKVLPPQSSSPNFEHLPSTENLIKSHQSPTDFTRQACWKSQTLRAPGFCVAPGHRHPLHRSLATCKPCSFKIHQMYFFIYTFCTALIRKCWKQPTLSRERQMGYTCIPRSEYMGECWTFLAK